ncbi:MAG: hypothetical protein NXH83_08945 [Rhodobacteraceae bacterium]|nr:hypothetical protein [Paracoccaceae bacterium]
MDDISRCAKTPMSFLENVRLSLMSDRAGFDPSAAVHALRAFTSWRGEDIPLAVPPSRHEIETHLEESVSRIGKSYAMANLANLQVAAPVLWGASYAGLIGRVIRDSRCEPKAPARTKIAVARTAIDQLPVDWQAGLIRRLSDEPGPAKHKWSADHVLAVAYAAARWQHWCERLERDVRPTGVAFHAYACDLAKDGLSSRSAGDYLSRIMSGYRTAFDPDFSSMACDHVISDLNAKGRTEGRRTKSGDQIIGASAIFDLGLHVIGRARNAGPRGLAVARDYRNGLLLILAVAVPQRARALSHFELGRTVVLLERPYLRIRLPGQALKQREHRKARAEYDKVIENALVWDAIEEYRRMYRPLFDDGAAMFPSFLEKNATISSAQLGRLVGTLTEKHFGVRVSIHRVRDNVATEASEELRDGGYLAPVLLGHSSPATTMASYDHAQGLTATRDFGEFLQTQRSRTSTLRL